MLAGALASVVAGDRLRVLALLVRPAADDHVPPTRSSDWTSWWGGSVGRARAGGRGPACRGAILSCRTGAGWRLVQRPYPGVHDARVGRWRGSRNGLPEGVDLSHGQGSRTQVAGEYAGATARARVSAASVAIEWLQPLVDTQPPKAWAGSHPDLAVFLEAVVVRPKPPADGVARGQMDPLVLRNALALAYMPRARACYLSRRVANWRLTWLCAGPASARASSRSGASSKTRSSVGPAWDRPEIGTLRA